MRRCDEYEFPTRIRRAAKSHRCSSCERHILIGERYVFQRWLERSPFSDQHHCTFLSWLTCLDCWMRLGGDRA
jgi:hypothetical protein